MSDLLERRKRLKTRAINQAKNVKSLDELRSNRHPVPTIVGVYFLFLGDELVYVGQSTSILARLCAHTFFDWDSFALIELHDFTREELELVETAYIQAYKPPYNRAVNVTQQRRIARFKRLPAPVKADSLA